MNFFRTKYLLAHGLIQKKQNLTILINYLISNITNTHQELKGGQMKDQVELLIQYYNISLLFQKPLLVKEVLIFHYLKN